MRLGWVLLAAPLLAGCLDFDKAYSEVERRLDGGAADAGDVDAGLPDAGELDAGGGPDAGEADAGTDAGTSDAGTSDAGTSDAGTSDAGTSDAGTSDAGTSDAGTSDAGTSDAGISDAGTSDAGTSDAGAADAGPLDAGARCGPGRLQFRELFVDDAGIVGFLAVAVDDAGVLLVGDRFGNTSAVRRLPSGAFYALPTQVLGGAGRTSDEVFTLDFAGGGAFRADAGYSSLLTGPCASDFAGAVNSPAPGSAVSCDEGSFAACRWTNGATARLAPVLTLPGRLTCSAVTLTADGGLLRGGTVRPDAGGLDGVGILLGPDGTQVPVPAGTASVSDVAATGMESIFMLDGYGGFHHRVDGGWRSTGTGSDGGLLFRSMAMVGTEAVLLAGTRPSLAFANGQGVCQATIDGLPASVTGYGWSAVASNGERIVLGGFFNRPDGGTDVGMAVIVELVPW